MRGCGVLDVFHILSPCPSHSLSPLVYCTYEPKITQLVSHTSNLCYHRIDNVSERAHKYKTTGLMGFRLKKCIFVTYQNPGIDWYKLILTPHQTRVNTQPRVASFLLRPSCQLIHYFISFRLLHQLEITPDTFPISALTLNVATALMNGCLVIVMRCSNFAEDWRAAHGVAPTVPPRTPGVGKCITSRVYSG